MKSKLLVYAAIAILAFILLIFIVATVGTIAVLTGNLSGGKTSSTAGSGNASCSILFPSGAGSDETIGKAIDQWIAQNGSSSPLKGKGILFARSGRSANVNPALIAGLARKESSFGIHIPDDTYNPFGRTASDSQPGVQIGTHKWYKFNSWDEAIAEEGPYLNRMYTSQGLTTLGDVIGKYCPKSECDTATYINQMAGWINEITSLAGGALGAGCVQTAGAGGEDIKQCLNSKEIVGPPIKNGKLAQATLADKLAQLWAINKSWRVTEACPPSSEHQDKNHQNGRAVDIAIYPQDNATPANIAKLLSDIHSVCFNDVLNEYSTDTKYKTGGHIHLEWNDEPKRCDK